MKKLSHPKKLKSKFKIVFALILLAGFLVWAILKLDQQNIKVEVSEQGFNPQNITLKQGDQITFINSGNWEHWPASNIHPTHLIYPEFDPKKALKKGESWTFRFEKNGNWRFHDHLLPSNTGQVIVLKNNHFLPSFQFSFNLVDWLKVRWQLFYYHLFPNQVGFLVSSANIFDLVKSDLPGLKNLISLAGSQKVLAKLLEQSNGGASIDCHQQSHQIGRLSYEDFGAQAFKTADQSCHSGYMHGAMEAFLKDKGTDNLGPKIDQLCSNFGTNFSQFECLHGVGHGVMAYEDYDLPKALEICHNLKDSFGQNSCFGGVFMENIVVSEGNGATPGHTTNWVSSDPLFPCNGVDQSYDVQIQCYLMQTSRMMDLYDHDFDKILPQCLRVPDNMKNTCFQSLGRDAAGQTLRDAGKINVICHKVPFSYYQDCLRGALFVIIEFWGNNMQDQPHQLCMVQDDPKNKRLCYELLGGRLPGIFGQDLPKIDQICSYSEKDYQGVCFLSASGQR